MFKAYDAKWSKRDFGWFEGDSENWYLPIGLDSSNSLNTSFKICLHLSLSGLGTDVEIGHSCGFSLKMAKGEMVIFRTDDNLSLAMILTLSKHHLESVGTQVWVILLICQEMVILVHKLKNDDKLECDFWFQW